MVGQLYEEDNFTRCIGLYIHFPFCLKKCRYCDFPSFDGVLDKMESYTEALCKEIGYYGNIAQLYTVKSIFMGGGTPTLFDIKLLDMVLKLIYKVFHISSDAEISIECNPGTADFEKLKALKAAGVNRISIGLQAWQDSILEKLGRIHDHNDFINTVDMARKAGFDNINADLIFGLPEQTIHDWLETLDNTAGLGLEHISTYGLKIEEGTEFYSLYKAGRLVLPNDDTERGMYHTAIERLASFGLMHYEISNFSYKGRECRHNINYWRNGEYIGCGSSSHSHLNRTRYSNSCDIDDYIYNVMEGSSPVAFKEYIDTETEIFETIMLGLRMKQGINDMDFYKRFGFFLRERYHDVISELVDKGMLLSENGFIKPTLKGMDYQNQIALAFI